MLIDHFKDEMIRSICKAGGRGRGEVRVSTALLLLVGVAAAATAAAAQHPCNPDDPIPHLPLGSRWHEYKEGYQAHNRTDLRSYEAEKLLEDGIVCVDQRLQAIGEAIGENNTLLEQRRTELRQLLTVVSSTLTSLSEQVKTLRPIKVDVHTHSDGALDAALVQQLLNTLVSQNQILTKIQSTLAVSVATPAINVNAIAALSSLALEPRADSAPRAQIEPSVPVATYYDPHATHVDFAIASIPDPRVPRHRRQYDNAIAAISQGMLIDGFVLDKFAFPWAKDLLPSVGSESKDDPKAELKVVDDPRYGLMLFRHDSWREASAAAHQVEIRALYVVTETGTYGVQPAALASAIAAIDEQWPVPAVAVQPAVEPLVLFGPAFSGSMNSIREILLKRGAEAALHGGSAVRSLHLVSPSATVESNKRVGVVSYDTLARSDTEKLEVIEKIRGKLNVDPEKVAIVYESTTFGIEACKNPAQAAPAELAICAKALKVPLPVNIADVRYGLRLKAAPQAQAGELQTLMPADVVHLSLEQGAENGSEFPESQQSPITAASTDLELKRLIAALSAGGAKLIIVIATDVRDRLFLIEQIASRLDGALYVDLGADRLLGHPDFIHATRGMLTLSSSRLTTVFADRHCFKEHPNEYRVWSTDEQASLACAIASWSRAPTAGQNAGVIPYVVSRIGLVSSDATTADARLQFASVIVATFLCLGFSVAGVLLAVTQRREAQIGPVGDSTNLLEPARATHWAAFLGLTLIIAAVIWVSVGSLALASLVAVVLYCYNYWTRQVTFRWSTAMIWINALLLMATATLQIIWAVEWGFNGLFSKNDPASDWHALLAGLSQAVTGGLAYPIAQCVGVASMFTTVWICRRIVQDSERAAWVLEHATGRSERVQLEEPAHHAGLVVASLAGVAALMAIISFWWFDARQVTVFGRLADFSIYLSLIATTLLAFCMLIGSLTAGARIGYLCDLVKRYLRVRHHIDVDRAEGTAQQPLMWQQLSEKRARFVATPGMANRWTGREVVNVYVTDEPRWAADLNRLLTTSPVDVDGLRALYAFLSSEMANYQFAILGVALATIASSGIVYLYPVSRATVLIGLNLLALLIAGVYSAFKTLRFEGDIVLSNVLCNRSQKKEWSLSLFIFIVLPFVVIAIALGIQQIPGVLSVGDGLVNALLKWAKPGG